MNALDIHVLLHVAEYIDMRDVAELRSTCKSNRLLFSSSNVIGQALVNQYGIDKVVFVAFKHCHEKVVLWICRNFTDQLDWWDISAYQKLSEDFIREFQDKVDWWAISRSQKLSETFIREFQDKMDWERISTFQKLSEEFIREFKDDVDWWHIFHYQKLSKAFRKEFSDKISEI